MDPLIARAVEDYDRLLKDEKELVEEVDDRLFERMRQAKLTFGGRVLCPFLRPNFVSPSVYEEVRGVCREIMGAIAKVEERLGTELWDRVDLTPEERELMAIEPGYRRSSPTSRLDAFLTPSAYQFVELNAESPAGIGYAEALTDLFLDLPVMQKFQERWTVRRFRARERLLETLLECYRDGGGQAERAAIARHVPWTRRVSEERTRRGGADIDLPEYIRAHRERLVMKPNDEYGGKGVYIGAEMSAVDWEAALAEALRSSYVVQDKVELRRESFPELG